MRNPSDKWAAAAFASALELVANAGEGDRNATLNKQAYGLGQLVGAGELLRDDVAAALLQAAETCGIKSRDAAYTIRRSMLEGEQNPRTAPDDDGGQRYRAAMQRPVAARMPPKRPQTYQRPPAAEVGALWAACGSVADDPEATAWFRSRALDPLAVAELDVARVIPAGARLPAWAQMGRDWFTAGHRVIVRTWEADPDRPGKVRAASLQARYIRADGEPKCKSAFPRGFQSGGSVALSWPADASRRVTISEGLPDFLTWAQKGERVIGVWSGSDGDPRLAAIVPDGWTVTIRTDPDGAGERYAQAWRALLSPRCKVLRPAAPDVRDVHNALEAVELATSIDDVELIEALCLRGGRLDPRVYSAAQKRRGELQARGA